MNALFPLPRTLLEQGSIPPQTIDALRSHGIDLSPTQISQLETHRKELLAEHERFEFDTWGLRVLLEELASCETICPDEFAGVAQSAITLFYEVRDAVDHAISDEDIAESIHLSGRLLRYLFAGSPSALGSRLVAGFMALSKGIASLTIPLATSAAFCLLS